MINYYKSLFKEWSDILKTFTDMSGKKSIFLWNEKSNQAFTQSKAMIAKAKMLPFPDFTKPFDLHTNSIDYQLRITRSQDKKLIILFSRELTSAQFNYIVTDK